MPDQAGHSPDSPRVLIAKPGLDGHDRGARMIVRVLEDAGFHVAYTGIRRTPEQIADEAKESGADVVGLSILSGAHMELIPRVLEALAQRGLEAVPVLAGGIIPEQDRLNLLEMGVVAVFGPGARSDVIIETFRGTAALRKRPAGAPPPFAGQGGSE
ncbi:MAG: cobalamin B12-binding domain-containing protein [Dehalococcoidia bacterium]